MGGGGGGKGGKGGGSQDYFRYYMSLHVGVASQVDDVLAIIMGDRAIWRGQVSQSRAFNITNEDLFGGKSREGGVNGGVTFLLGEDHQHMPAYLLEKFGTSADLIPSYRGLTSLFFHDRLADAYNDSLLGDLYNVGQDTGFQPSDAQQDGSGVFGPLLAKALAVLTGRRGFYFQANNPYLRTLKVLCTRRPKGLTRKYSAIPRGGGVDDANPAHIIYELQTNRDFGAGLAITRINVESFEVAAQTLYNEGFGLSLKWIRQGKVKDLILEILDHINALLYEDPRTGLLTLKLLRGDYDVDALPTANYSNCVVTNFQRKSEELINEVVVTYTNPDTYEDSSVTVQDLAGIAMEGGVVSTSRNYYAVHKSNLAKSLGERDLRAESYPLATADVELLREFWEVAPGDVIKLDSPEDGDEVFIMRVMSVEDEPSGKGGLKAKVVQDVFSLEAAPVISTPTPIIDYDDPDPNEAEAVQPFTMPYTFSVISGLTPAGGAEYPTAHLGILASSRQNAVDFFNIESEVQGTLGSLRFEVVGTGTMVPRGLTTEVLPAEAESTLTFPSLSNGAAPEQEFWIVIGSGGDADMEIAAIMSITDGVATIRRGLYDTVPREWPVNTPIWILDPAYAVWDSTQRSAFENVEFKVLPISVGGALASEDATLLNYTLGERPHLPFRPANVAVEGVGFGTYVSPDREGKTVSWSNRYRQGEDAVILSWWDATVAPEPGQTTEIDILRVSDGTPVTQFTGLTGTSFFVPKTAWGGETEIIVKVWAARDGYRSLQAHEIRVEFPAPPGYGMAYGASWGA